MKRIERTAEGEAEETATLSGAEVHFVRGGIESIGESFNDTPFLILPPQSRGEDD